MKKDYFFKNENFSTLPIEAGEKIGILKIDSCQELTSLPPDLVAERVHIIDCTNLTSLPEGWWVGELLIQDCPALETMPRDLVAREVMIESCDSITALPDK